MARSKNGTFTRKGSNSTYFKHLPIGCKFMLSGIGDLTIYEKSADSKGVPVGTKLNSRKYGAFLDEKSIVSFGQLAQTQKVVLN